MNLRTKLKSVLSHRPIVAGAFVGLFLAATAVWFSGGAQGINLGTIPQDCDNNAVIKCGAADTASLIKQYDTNTGGVQDIYTGFKITSAQVHAMGTTAVAGTVTKSGDVMVGNTVVATNAVTAGRLDIPVSTKRTVGKTTFYQRTPSVSFANDSLAAFVVMQNGTFSYAIIGACGNPVNATPKLPNYTIKKEVQAKGTTTWAKSVNVKSGTTVSYRVTIASTGAIPLNNLVVSDMLPANVTYTAGSLKLNNQPLTFDTAYFGGGRTLAPLNNGATDVITYDAVVGKTDVVATCTAQTLVNTVKMTAAGLTAKQDTATVVKACLPKPPVVTPPVTHPNDSITKEVQAKGATTWASNVSVKAGAALSYRVTVKNTGDVSLASVVVSDKLPAHVTFTAGSLRQNGQAVSNEANFFANGLTVANLAAGASVVFTYDATVAGDPTAATCSPETLPNTANVVATGLTAKQASASVSKTCEVVPPKPTPVYQCTTLGVVANTAHTSFTFTPSTRIENASFKSAVYTIKDNSGAVINTINATNLNAVTYNRTQPGDYTVNLVVTVTVDGQDKVATGTCAGSFNVPTPSPTPVYSCRALNVTTNGRTSFSFLPDADIQHATLKSATYTVKSASGTVVDTITRADLNSTNYTQTNVGDYTVALVIIVTVDGQDKVATGTCAGSFTVKPVPVEPTPTAECTLLASQVAGNIYSYNFTVKYTVTGSLTPILATMSWGDGTADSTIPVADLGSFAHTFAKAGNYTQSANITFSNGNKGGSAICKSSISIATPATPVTPATPAQPAKPTPTQLVNTGPADLIGMVASMMIAGMIAYRTVWLRRIQG